MLGTLPLPLRGKKHFVIHGGPYYKKPLGMMGVKMAKEVQLADDDSTQINIPTVDYNVPPKLAMADGLVRAVDAITKGEPLYVGCMGGKGRTGLFLAILARCFGIDQPVEYVREHYYAHAVETDAQYRYVMNFEIPASIPKKIAKAKFKSYFTPFRHCLTTNR